MPRKNDDKGKKRLVPIEPASEHSRLLPKDNSSVSKLYWSFGFKFYKQIDKFGFSNIRMEWFSSVLERLRQTSKMEYTGMSEVLEGGYRYHIINWESKKCPLTRTEFDWIDPVYLKNEIEYPFCQFHISKATGRIIGFWDENNVFQIILLDPLHNLQPSAKVQYEIRDTFPVMSEYDSLWLDLHNIMDKSCNHDDCSTLKQLRDLPTGITNSNIIMAHLDDSYFEEYSKISKGKTIRQILEAGILHYSENP
ncbi:hypothetical protein [Flavobacterium johnsoniae]|uniref:Uncharacterized protein n=1 Tax=Flavobacterium johnsoniae (strain ATCC 17061 / DSM 2064 / JCM 8514 / BCRC 14874 / CCUG 350202 / NBRC 14942 / NCIMB 11054 / UW101) TaxID=376686 RepID=A5FLG3_FLAJ1|nr:hypothetical protein [Flavobacterium johnsoniae]ABQ03956.1 hypothetical protein Fjoh_0922 [Flavobacterium johnsoniae UW101]OXE96172.1 hypothetical protein B0A63_21905 [Flavobacterium johnsoniae UW101]WQG79175.1 hypothetical protein SR927_14225 [Flavobacterium johnsoniae UW101]SHK07945.1 hypothetical protein SAMN05444146_0328 [Flavobacterium johnsoniae]